MKNSRKILASPENDAVTDRHPDRAKRPTVDVDVKLRLTYVELCGVLSILTAWYIGF